MLVDAFRGMLRFRLALGSRFDLLDEGFFFFLLLGEATPSRDRGDSWVEGAGDCGGVTIVSGPGGDTNPITTSFSSLSVEVVAGFFFFGFFFFFFLGMVDRPSSSSSSMSSTVAFFDRCVGAGRHDELELQCVCSVTQKVLYR